MKLSREQAKETGRPQRWRALVIRVLLFTLVACSLAFTSRSVNRLVRAQAQTRAVSVQLSRVNADIETLQSQWPEEEVHKLLQSFAQLPALTYSNQEALGEWLRELKSRADPLALDANVQFGTANPPIFTNRVVSTIPATVTIQLRPQEPTAPPRSPYQRLLHLIQHLIDQPKRADLVGLEVHGASNSINRAVATINLWAGEEGPEEGP